MNILMSGASGLVGTALASRLTTDGETVLKLVRRPPADHELRWYPDQGVLPQGRLGEVDAVVHLSGENIASGRWSAERKHRLRTSRIESTELLCKTLAASDSRPRVFVSASAIGIYGNRGDDVLTESSEPGSGFLTDLCRDWEHATRSLEEVGVRVVHVRIGVVLSKAGGALSKMLLPFRLGLGGVLGSGKQYMSWITLDDLVAAIRFCIDSGDLRGPVNAVSPQPVTNRVFTKALGRALQRPTIFPVPAFMLRLLVGEMADALLLSSARVVPEKLTNAGFPFRQADIDTALAHVLKS